MFKLLNAKTTKTTLTTSIKSIDTLAINMTNVACSSVINYFEQNGNASLVGHVVNVCNESNNKVTNATKAFMVKFVGISIAKDETTKEALKDANGFTIYKKNQSKYDILLTKAVDEGVDVENKEELTAYVTGLLNAELERLGGTVLSVVKKTPLTDAEKEAKRLVTMDKFFANVQKDQSTNAIIASMDKTGLLALVEAHLDFQASIS